MSEERFELALRRMLYDLAPADVPVELRWAVLDVPSARPQRGRWPTSRVVPGRFGHKATRLAWALLVVATLIALIGSVIASGALQRSPAPPYGLARPGLIAFDSGARIVVTDAEGSNPRQLVTGGDLDTAAKWSGNGTQLAFWRAIGQRWCIVIVNADGSARATVATGAPFAAGDAEQWANGVPSGLDWSPDSRRLAFSMLTDAVPHVWVVASDGTDLHTVGDPTLPASDPAWSSDGTQIAFHGGQGTEPDGIYVMNADGSDVHRISRTSGNGIAFVAPRWQPGGDLVAYQANPVDALHVFVVRADGSAERDVSLAVPGAPSDSWPSWSPDGTRLAFVRGRVGKPGYQIVVADPDGGHPALPSHPPVDQRGVEWSPDARFVVGYLNEPGTINGYGVLIVDLTGALPPKTVAAANNAEVHWQRLAP